MKILGIDPGLRVTGFGVIRKEGQRLSYIASGTIQVPDGDLPSRLKVILEGVGQVVSNYQHRDTKARRGGEPTSSFPLCCHLIWSCLVQPGLVLSF